VRGYRNRLIASDEAVVVRTELRAPVLPRFLPGGAEEQVQPLLFVDSGWAENVSAQGGELHKDEMLGAGVGLRFSIFDDALTGRVDAGWALKDVESTASNEEGDLTVHFGIEYSF
jgi:hemolysin activation/secretion protein